MQAAGLLLPQTAAVLTASREAVTATVALPSMQLMLGNCQWLTMHLYLTTCHWSQEFVQETVLAAGVCIMIGA